MEVLDIPLVGSPAECGFIAMNKAIARSICIANGVRMAEGFIVHQGDDVTLLMDKISFPCVVKPAQSEDSMGVTLVKEKNELDEALKKAYEYDQVLLIERYRVGAGANGKADYTKFLNCRDVCCFNGFLYIAVNLPQNVIE